MNNIAHVKTIKSRIFFIENQQFFY